MSDPWTTKCIPSGGSVDNKDIYNRRNGKRPNDQMVKVLQDTIEQSRASVSKKLVEAKKTLNLDLVKESIENMRGACTIVYPMGLPPHDPIQAIRGLIYSINENLISFKFGL